MIKRELSKTIVKYIELNKGHKNVLIIDGVRQTGKTTIVQSALIGHKAPFLEINLEKQKSVRALIDQTSQFSEFEFLLKRDFGFEPSKGTILFIDEANESLKLGQYVRQMKEDWRDQTVILTGSMMQRLFRDPEMRIPVGRFETLTVQPFSFSEFLLANEKTSSSIQKYGLHDLVNNPDAVKKISTQDHQVLLSLMDHYLTCGGLPEIVLKYLDSSGEVQIKNLHVEYLETLKDDFLKLFSVEYANLFDRAIYSVSNLLAQPYKKTAMIQNNNKLADNILSVFEKWKVIIKVEQRTHKPTASNSFYPKRYLFDNGISKTKREMGLPPIQLLHTLNSAQREPLGGLIEQMVCHELFLVFRDLCGFREKNYEIDFVTKTREQVIPIECKASLKPNQNQYRGLDLYNRDYKNKKAVLVSLAPYSDVTRDGYTILHVPAYALGCLNHLIFDK
ncbi:MAG: ATP-binding protein [Deltaproteobacteria bacterium]|nr:ATP-binding protein [Deltaproteobacteria bacterium]